MPSTNQATKDGAHSSTGDRQLRRTRLSPCLRSIDWRCPCIPEQEYTGCSSPTAAQAEAETDHLFDPHGCPVSLSIVMLPGMMATLTEPPAEDLGDITRLSQDGQCQAEVWTTQTSGTSNSCLALAAAEEQLKQRCKLSVKHAMARMKYPPI